MGTAGDVAILGKVAKSKAPSLVSMPIVFSTSDREQKVDQDTAEN
jgi:hypothetical protein